MNPVMSPGVTHVVIPAIAVSLARPHAESFICGACEAGNDAHKRRETMCPSAGALQRKQRPQHTNDSNYMCWSPSCSTMRTQVNAAKSKLMLPPHALCRLRLKQLEYRDRFQPMRIEPACMISMVPYWLCVNV